MLPRKNRLTKKKDFDELVRRGRGISGSLLFLKFLKRNVDSLRIGFVVSKKVSNKAVVRNKIKRRIREIIRKKMSEMKTGYDLVFFAKKEVEGVGSGVIEQEISELLKKAKIL